MQGPYVHPDWFKVGPAGQCPKCREDRPDLLTRVEDSYGDRSFCHVCANEWRHLVGVAEGHGSRDTKS